MLRLLFDMATTSVDIEHAIFTNSKSDIGYKTAMLKKVAPLRKQTTRKDSLVVAVKPELMLSHLANEEQVALLYT